MLRFPSLLGSTFGSLAVLLGAAATAQAEPQGPLRINAPEPAVELVLAPMVADFLAAYDTGSAPCFRISAINGDGCRPLIYKLQEALDTLAPPPPLKESSPDEFFPDDEAIDDSDNNPSR